MTRLPHRAVNGYQAPRSPTALITRERRTAAFSQLVCTARWAFAPSPASSALMIASCSATEVATSLTRVLV